MTLQALNSSEQANLKIYDALLAKKLNFISNNGIAKIFICGPTVYDYAHIGHARLLLFYDTVARYLLFKGVRPVMIVNITDVDAKVYQRAWKESISPSKLANRYFDSLLADMSALGAHHFILAKVSDYIDTAIKLVKDLLGAKKAYSGGGNIYLDTSSIDTYGRLSKMTKLELDDCRLDIGPGKHAPSDILLWNSSDYFDSHRDPSDLDSALHDPILGSGIPWWHMQDTSVAISTFNGTYDIHGGASELAYPHHESHLAQLQSIKSLKKPVNFWMYVGLLYINGKKMSKSMNNTILVKDLLKTYDANVLRLYLLSKHYRTRFDFSEAALAKFEDTDKKLAIAMNTTKTNRTVNKEVQSTPKNSRPPLIDGFMSRIEDDFDTVEALKIMLRAAKSDNRKDLETMVNIFGLRY